MKGKYLITTDAWFYGADGKQYKSVWGEVEIVSDAVLGIKTNVRSSNWFAKIGTENNHIVVAGCQIHYAVKCEICPNLSEVEEYNADAANGINKYIRPSTIYAAF